MNHYSNWVRFSVLLGMVICFSLATEVSAFAAPKLTAVMEPTWSSQMAKLDQKVAKKRKSKKFLGIFKRKSNCGCPKHK